MSSSSSEAQGNSGDIRNFHRSTNTRNLNRRKREHKAVAAGEKDESWYMPLYRASLTGDWQSAERFFEKDKDAITAKITANSETALHIAVGAGRSILFVQNLVANMPREKLCLPSDNGNTALHIAAMVGNTEAAVILVKENPDLLHIKNAHGWLPVHRAAMYADRETLSHLLLASLEGRTEPISSTDQSAEELSPFAGRSGVQLLFIMVIISGFFDVAIDMVKRYPDLATSKLENGRHALLEIADMASAFPSGCQLNCWQRALYSRVPVKLENNLNDTSGSDDIENPADRAQAFLPMRGWVRLFRGNCFISVLQKLYAMHWEVIELLVPQVKHIRAKKLMHHQALQLVKCLCEKIESLNSSQAHSSFYCEPILVAAKAGIHEVVETIVETFPAAIWSDEGDFHYIFQLAVIHRCENVFNLMYQMSEHRQRFAQFFDLEGNTILHLAAKLAPPHKLSLASGAALQMQREIQWYKEVEKFVTPYYKDWLNDDRETPAMVFTREHRNLVIEGEKWMKDTANSCTIAAALIATVVFAAAITVPGGNDSVTGLPFFSRDGAFVIFSVSDAISLFASITSLLMFLSILTSRYAEGDFLYILPKRLIIGLVALFLSITTLMIAFSATIYLGFGQKREWVLIPVAAFACLPVTSFVFLQFPLLLEVISSTYGPSIFGKQSDRPFY